MNDQTVNIPLLRKAVEWAEAEAAKPAEDCEWMQSAWVSSPEDRAFTLAVESLPWDASYTDVHHRAKQILPTLNCGTCYCIAGYVALAHLGSDVDHDYGDDIEEAAREAMGITAAQGEALFASDNTIQVVRNIAEQIAGERL